MRSPKDGSVTLQVAVVGKYLNGRRGKHGRARYAFVIHRFPFALSALWKKYRRRFGIESAHRVWEQARARTWRRAGLRLLLLGIAVLVHNLWIWLKWTWLSWPRRGPGGREVWNKGLPFRRLLLFLAHAIERRLGAVEALFLPVRSVYHLMQKYGEKANLPKEKRKFHVLKHSIATHLIDAGAEIMFVKDWLGHKNVQNTLVYAQLVGRTRDEQARQVFSSSKIV